MQPDQPGALSTGTAVGTLAAYAAAYAAGHRHGDGQPRRDGLTRPSPEAAVGYI